MKKVFLLILAAVTCLASADSLAVSAPGTVLPPPSTGGIAVIDPLLAKLTTHRRLLVIAAHPDDEDTALLTLVARGMGGEAAYLSLSRGDGGQNLIGDELGVALGLIRTQELNSARRLDGARQYFTRAYDFGYSKSLEEALQFWPRQEVLEDAVRVIRRFRPQVVDHIFSGTPRDGHGQHQESALIARDAFKAAGDPAAFPDLAREGLTPWQPRAMYRSTRFLDREATTIVLPTGGIDPISGRSYQQIAVASRSLHHSQGTGALQLIGPNETRVAWEEGGAGSGGKDLFAGIDTRLAAIAAEVSDPARRRKMEERLETAQKIAEETRRNLLPSKLDAAVAPLCAALEELRAARALVARPPANEQSVAMLLDEKIAAAQTAIAAAAGVTIDAIADRETAPAGEPIATTVSIWNAGSRKIDVERVELTSSDGWRVPEADARARGIEPGKIEEWKLAPAVPEGKRIPTIPYFLRRPVGRGLYDWTEAPGYVRGEPFQPPPLSASALVTIAGSHLLISREVTYRFRDEAFGEIRHSLRAVAKAEVSVEPNLIVWPIGRKPSARLEVAVVSNSSAPVSGRVEAAVPAGWPAVAPQAFSLSRMGDRVLVGVSVVPPATLPPGRSAISVAAVVDGGERLAGSVRLIDYEHIAPTPAPYNSLIDVSAVALELPRLNRVGYVRGAADREPELLAAVGVPIRVLDQRELESGDLSRYDAIVVGPRAYETDPALSRSNARLLDYVRAGGLAIVQYQQYPFIQGSYAPDKLEIARPHDRVTDETVPVKILEPSHPIFTTPNRIGQEDWDGWVQERGLYFAHSWGPAYTPLLGMADPGEDEKRGGLLAATIGKGHYVYTGLAFFRQLPAGVPGAYRLFANLLAWKAR